MNFSRLTFKFHIVCDHKGADGFPGLDSTIRDPYSSQTSRHFVNLGWQVVDGSLPLDALRSCQRLQVYVPGVLLLVGNLNDIPS